jgi:excisionase family DNA binding protein
MRKGALKMSNKPQLLTVSECAECVQGLTKFRIRQMVLDGTLPHIKAGRKILINKNVLLKTLGE